MLVAFAWAQNKEIKTSEKHPHFLACDITFGVNRQRRDFFSCWMWWKNRAFTAFCCFIPSKQEQAYTWILNEALTHILTPETLMHNQCISCDQELSLNSSLHTSIKSNKSSFSNSRLRLDCYHFLTKYSWKRLQWKPKTQMILSLL